MYDISWIQLGDVLIFFFTVVFQLPVLKIYLYSNQEDTNIATTLSCCVARDVNNVVVQLNFFLLSLCIGGLTP